MPAQRPGKRIDRYLVVDRVGAGGMGQVFKAYDPYLGRLVAIKVVKGRASRALDPHRLRREAQAIAQLSHPNVIAVHDVGTTGESVFVAMEYVEGQSLREWLAAERRDRGEILAVFEQAARGLAAAHDAGLVHRDFKPSNVLVGTDGRVRVLDFGLAVRDGDESRPRKRAQTRAPMLDRDLTRPGVVAGTPRYMAPEQHAAGTVDARADQWAFCAALYEAVTDDRPFDPGADYNELAANVKAGRLRPIADSLALPGWLRDLILRGLAVDPSRRFGSMTEVIDELVRDRVTLRRDALDGSGSTEAMIAAFPPPADERTAERVQWLRQRLEYAWQLKRSGDFPGAIALARVVADEAHKVDYLPLRAAALYILGNLQHRTGDPASAKETLYLAAEIAGHAGDDWQIANILVFQVAVLGDGLRRYQEAEGIARIAEIEIARLGDNPSLRSRLHHNRGRNLRDEGRHQDALREYELALALDEQTHGHGHPFVVRSLSNLAETLLELGRTPLARRHLDRALTICRDTDTAGPALATCLLVLGRALVADGDTALAVPYLEEAQRVWERYPDRGTDLAETLTELALCRLLAGDTAGAVDLGERAMRTHGRGAYDPLSLASTQLGLAVALAAAGDDDSRVSELTDAARTACEQLGAAGASAFARAEERIKRAAPRA